MKTWIIVCVLCVRFSTLTAEAVCEKDLEYTGQLCNIRRPGQCGADAKCMVASNGRAICCRPRRFYCPEYMTSTDKQCDPKNRDEDLCGHFERCHPISPLAGICCKPSTNSPLSLAQCIGNSISQEGYCSPGFSDRDCTQGSTCVRQPGGKKGICCRGIRCSLPKHYPHAVPCNPTNKADNVCGPRGICEDPNVPLTPNLGGGICCEQLQETCTNSSFYRRRRACDPRSPDGCGHNAYCQPRTPEEGFCCYRRTLPNTITTQSSGLKSGGETVAKLLGHVTLMGVWFFVYISNKIAVSHS